MRPIDRRTALKTLGGGLAGASLLPAAALWGDDRPTAVIVGSGISGLSAAYDLQRAGFAVTVIEKEGMAGGRMVDAWIGPRYMNPHAGGVLTAYREMWALAEEVNVSLGGDFPFDESVIDNGHGTYNHALRFLFTEIMNIPGLSDETKKQLPKLFPDLARIREEVDPCYLTTGLDYDNESMTEYYERMVGKSSAKEIIDYWVDPAFDAWGSTPDTGNCIVLLSWFAQQEADFNIPREGIGVLTRRLAELVPIQYNTTVMRVTDADQSGRHTVHYLSPDGQRGSVTPDVVICATQGKYVPQIVERLTDKQRALFDQVFFTKYASTIFLLKEEFAPADFTYARYTPSHPDPEKRRLYYWGAAPVDFADREKRPSFEVVPARREIANWIGSGRTLPSYCLELARPFYPIDDHMVDDVVVNAGDDLVDVPPGFAAKMAAVIREQEQERRGLYFTGEYLGAPHTGGACASGRVVARTIRKHWA